MTENVNAKLVIVGCGIAGIAAAHRLIKAGYRHVRILESTARPGGRIKTGRIGDKVIEIGASYIHGPSKDNPVFCLSRDYNLLEPEALTSKNQSQDVDEYPPWIANWFTSSGQKVNDECMNPALEFLHGLVDNTPLPKKTQKRSWDSVGQFIRSEAKRRGEKRWKNKDETTRHLLLCALSALLKFESCSSAVHTMDDLDLVGFSLYKSIRGVDCMFPRGFEGLIDKLMSELPADVVMYNQPVRCVYWNNTMAGAGPVTVECEDGEHIVADHVILTVPLGYLKKHHSTLFSPPLPKPKLSSILKWGFGTCDKLYVEFDSPWWDNDCEIIYLVWEDEEEITDQVLDISKNWTRKIPCFTVIKPCESGSHVLCGWIAGREAEHMETLSEEEIRRSITALIHTFTGNPTITPKRIQCTQWFSDPWTCGSYSHPAVGCSAQDIKNIAEPLPNKGEHSQVLFAGEATHFCYYSTVHGALLSGWREADRLISHYF